jgi:hypothetical protein
MEPDPSTGVWIGLRGCAPPVLGVTARCRHATGTRRLATTWAMVRILKPALSEEKLL